MSSRRQAVADRYLLFAKSEAVGLSPLYEALAVAVATHGPTLDFLLTVPQPKQQPNLLFAAVRWVCGDPSDSDQFFEFLHSRLSEVRDVMLARSVQTNEPGRCASILPLLAQVPSPIALIEIGASAGLCLLPDKYGYRYGTTTVGTNELVFPCDVDTNTPVPQKLPEIAWRAGLDLNPVSLEDEDEVRWLECLVWPEHHARLSRLRTAINIARSTPVRVERGDLRYDLEGLVAEAPVDCHAVVMHSAVLAYVPRSDVESFIAKMDRLNCDWISNEAANVLQFTSRVRDRDRTLSSFVLSMNKTPVATTSPHGEWLEWIATESAPA